MRAEALPGLPTSPRGTKVLRHPTLQTQYPDDMLDEEDAPKVGAGLDRSGTPSPLLRTRTTMAAAGVVVALGLGMTAWFGVGVMGWSLLQSAYFFAITVSTVGFGTCGVENRRELAWLLLYMWCCVAIFGLAIALIVESAHGSVERLVEGAAFCGEADGDGDGGDGDGEGAAGAPLVGQATGPRAGRMVRAARGKLALLRSKVILVGAEGAVVFLVAVFFMVANEGRIRR